MRLINADALKRKVQQQATLSGKMKIKTSVETVLNQVIDWIDETQTIEQEFRWIPVEEKLPENTETVLITHRGGTSFGWYNGRYWERGAGQKHIALKTVKAWMPLPAPYKEDE